LVAAVRPRCALQKGELPSTPTSPRPARLPARRPSGTRPARRRGDPHRPDAGTRHAWHSLANRSRPEDAQLVMDGIAIRPISPSEIDAACAVIGLAFADNPNTLVMAGAPRRDLCDRPVDPAPRRPRRAARAGQLRAHRQRRGWPRHRAATGVPRAAHPCHQPGAAAHPGRDRMPGPAPRSSRRCDVRRARGPGELRCGPAPGRAGP
jgi:hypothetical protein